MLIEAAASQSHDADDSSGDDKDDGDQLSLDSLIKPADWPDGKNWGTLSILRTPARLQQDQEHP